MESLNYTAHKKNLKESVESLRARV